MLSGMTPEFLTRADLLRAGATRRSIQAAVRRGDVIHVRRDRYLTADVDERFARAVRVGGRLTCLSLLAVLGVFVLENRDLHVHVDPTSSRLRFMRQNEKWNTRLDTARKRVKIHWATLIDEAGASCSVGVLDAVAHAVLCQAPRSAIATIDSALHQGFIVESQLAELFAALPARFRPLLPLVDGRAESGPETLVRLMARMLGCDIAIQVEFDEIGRVDLVLDGWLVVECDSKQFHSSWEAQVRDRERDLALAVKGFSTLRLTAATIMYRPDDAFAALRGLIESRRR
jgi:very-short-patch-repair endonuclease